MRTTGSGDGRAIRLSVWYPRSEDRRGRRLPVGYLFELLAAENQFPETDGMPVDRMFPAVLTGDPGALSAAQSAEGLGMATAARVGAEPAAGRFPLVLWSSRHATVLAQAPMAEALASLGLVVATVWSSEPPLAFIWETRTEADKLATIDAQVLDLEFAITELGARAWVDTSRIVVAAWSYGGQTAARVQERVAAVRGIVSLDANVVPQRPEERLSLRRPLVFLVGQDTTRRGFDRIDGLTAPVVVARLPGLTHGEFNAMEGFLPALLGADTAYAWSRTGREAREGYRSLVELVAAAVPLLLGDPGPTAAAIADRLRGVTTSPAVEVLSRGAAP